MKSELIKILRTRNILLYCVIAVCLSTIGIYLAFRFFDPDSLSSIFARQLSAFLAIGGAGVGFGSFLIRFLNADKKADSFSVTLGRTKFERELSELKELLQNDVGDSLDAFLNDSSKFKQIQDSVYAKISENLEAKIVTNLRSTFSDDFKKDLKFKLIQAQLVPIIQDTEGYIYRLKRNSIINILIGICATIVAISVLGLSVLAESNSSTDLGHYLMHFIPRFTFAIFIQLFAFFFLKLYKNNLEDAKYFQNELTNLNAKTTALKVAIILANTAAIEKLIIQLASTERNFKLSKDESMQGLEKAKIDAASDKNALDAFAEFLKTYHNGHKNPNY